MFFPGFFVRFLTILSLCCTSALATGGGGHETPPPLLSTDPTSWTSPLLGQTGGNPDRMDTRGIVTGVWIPRHSESVLLMASGASGQQGGQSDR
jgi:hypothetical protein